MNFLPFFVSIRYDFPCHTTLYSDLIEEQTTEDCIAKGWGLRNFNQTNPKDYIMRELSTEELEIVVGGSPIVID